MNLERYTYFVNNNFLDYEFYSEGPKGKIGKVVRFTKVLEDSTIYNLGFGDLNGENGKFDDNAITDNKDRDKVLATVANTIIDFTNHYGDYYVFAMGSTPARTRLYQMGIANLFEEISTSFEVYGWRNNNWHRFERDVNYEAFLVKRK
jgi:hypothetical protein